MSTRSCITACRCLIFTRDLGLAEVDVTQQEPHRIVLWRHVAVVPVDDLRTGERGAVVLDEMIERGGG